MEVKERVSRLEEAIEEFVKSVGIEFNKLYNSQMRTEAELRAFKDEMRAFKDEMKVFKDEMKVFKDEMKAFKDEMKVFKEEMKAFKDEMKVFKDEMKVFKDEMNAFKDEMKDFKDEMNKKWGDLARKLGTVAEDIVAPGIPYAIKKTFNLDVTEVSVRRRKRIDGEEREYDVIAVAGEYVFLIDVKSTYRKGYLDEFEELKGDFFKYFREYKSLRIVPVIASFSFSEEILKAATKRGWLAVQLGGDYLEFINKDKVKLP